MYNTPRHNLPLIAPAQAQKHITHNEALMTLDRLAQLSVQSRTQIVPPEPAADGAAFIIAPNAQGEWLEKEGQIAVRLDQNWRYFAPKDGYLAWCVVEEALLAYRAGAWSLAVPEKSVLEVDHVGINSTSSTQNRLAVSSPNSLFTFDDGQNGDARITVNKQNATSTASVVFQDSYIGHAEFGLTNANNFCLKTSLDGQSWGDALCIKADSRYLGVNTTQPKGPLNIVHTGAGNVVEMWIEDNANANVSMRMRHVSCINNGVDFSINSSLSFILNQRENANIIFAMQNSELIRMTPDKRVGIENNLPKSTLDVGGAVRVGQYDLASRPSAASVGAGAIIYVSDIATGPSLQVSTGAQWLTVAVS